MEVKDAPPKIDTPNAGGDGHDDLRVQILTNNGFKPGVSGPTVIKAVTSSFEDAGVPLAGLYVTRAICHCGKGCPEGALYGLTLPMTGMSLSVLMDFYLTLGGTDIKSTTDPEVQRGIFRAYLDL